LDIETLASLKPYNRGARKQREWFSVRNLATGEAEVFIYDFIGFDPWLGGVAAKDFVAQLRRTAAQKILLRINSPGGDIAEAVTIRNALIEHPASIETHIDGLAASSASWVGLAAEKVIMSPHATLMIHEPWNIVMGDAQAMRKEADVLDKFGDEIASMLVEKAGGTREEWRDRMREETWYSDQEAVDAGLADEIAGAPAESAENRYDAAILALYRRTPSHLTEGAAHPSPLQQQEAGPHPELVQAALEHYREQSRRLGVAV